MIINIKENLALLLGQGGLPMHGTVPLTDQCEVTSQN